MHILFFRNEGRRGTVKLPSLQEILPRVVLEIMEGSEFELSPLPINFGRELSLRNGKIVRVMMFII